MQHRYTGLGVEERNSSEQNDGHRVIRMSNQHFEEERREMDLRLTAYSFQ
jgi:hypothetical protein